MAKINILVIEDNIDTAQNIKLYMEHNGFNCTVVHCGLLGVEAFVKGGHDLVVLDRMLPGLDGIAVCKQIRKLSNVPIIMLTAKISDHDLVDGLSSGADEYVKKPYSNKELIARVKAHLRRSESLVAVTEDVVHIADYSINKRACIIQFNQQTLTLTKTEYLILAKLLSSPRQVFTREQLFLAAFDSTHESIDRTIDVHLHNLRHKVAKIASQSNNTKHGIKSVYGMGYKLDIS